jgi:hypothetical protein
MPIEITPDWGTKISLIEVAQERHCDFVSGTVGAWTDNNINGFFVKPDDSPDTTINLLMDKFCEYCRYHRKKEVIHTVDTCGDLHLASSKKPCNEHAIARLKKNRWKVTTRKHPGKEPPHNDKYLFWRCLLHETEPYLPLKRFNGVRCKSTLVGMNSTPVIQKPNGKFEKDRRSEARTSVLPEEATHFGDAVDKRRWTKYASSSKAARLSLCPVSKLILKDFFRIGTCCRQGYPAHSCHISVRLRQGAVCCVQNKTILCFISFIC